ncbi:MAG TPA: NRDE family protein [Stellaceae bacterium]|nr:NRDE family protein [Stellaceae bacterium]
MCTLLILRRPDHAWPLVFAANRDEMIDRPWRAPGRHWPDRPEVVAGLDLLAGGSWLGINDWGVAAAILNRHGSLGPQPGLRSRGELVLEALDHADAVEAAAALADLDPRSYRTFNLIVGDSRDVFWLRHAGGKGIECRPVAEGLSLIAAGDLDDLSERRLALAGPRFAAARPPDPGTRGWKAWEALLASSEKPPGEPENAALRFSTPRGYGTVSSALLAIPAPNEAGRRPVFRFAAWQPGPTAWHDVIGPQPPP